MNILQEAYYKRIAENNRNVQFWEDYLQKLKSLDFNAFSTKLKVPALVPVGSRIFFRGELKHTNEVTVALGADYFVKCSLSQADVLRQHRIKDAQSKLDLFNQEKEYLENQMNFTTSNIYEKDGHEIVEDYTEEEDEAWRKQHRENVRQYKQNKVKDVETATENITDEELWNRLEELELQEELENEMEAWNKDVDNIKEESSINHLAEENSASANTDNNINIVDIREDKTKLEKETENKSKKVTFQTPTQIPKLELLQQVINRQNELENKLLELKNRESSESKNEEDLITKLDEMEQLDELEDEMDRLDDIIQNEDIMEGDDDSNKSESSKIQRRVSFVDEDDSETIELTFDHSSVEADNASYDPEKGITKPSDIYKAYSHLFENETTSILKKSKYALTEESIRIPDTKQVQKENFDEDTPEVNETIVIKDIVEKNQPCDKIGSTSRPTSLFKKRRMQTKS